MTSHCYEFIQQIHMEPYAKVTLWLSIPGIDAVYRQDSIPGIDAVYRQDSRGSLSPSGTGQVKTDQNIPDCSPQCT